MDSIQYKVLCQEAEVVSNGLSFYLNKQWKEDLKTIQTQNKEESSAHALNVLSKYRRKWFPKSLLATNVIILVVTANILYIYNVQ